MLKKAVLLIFLVFPINVFAYQGFEDSKIVPGTPYSLFSSIPIEMDGKHIRAIRTGGAKTDQEISGGTEGRLSLYSQDFTVPTRGGLSIPGLSRSFYHGVDPNTEDGIPWYYAYYSTHNFQFAQLIPAGYWRFNIPYIRIEYEDNGGSGWARFYVYNEDGGCSELYSPQGDASAYHPFALKSGPQSEGFVEDIGGFLYIPREGDHYPLGGTDKLYILRRDGVTYEFQAFQNYSIGSDFYIFDYKLISVYGNTYDPSLRNKITYYYEGSGINTKLDSIKTSSDKMIKFHYSEGVLDTIRLPDETPYHYEYKTEGSNKAINKVTDPAGRVTEYCYHSYGLGVYFRVDSIINKNGLRKIYKYSNNNKFFADTVIQIDHQYNISDTVITCIDTLINAFKKTVTLNGTQTNEYFWKRTYASYQEREISYSTKHINPLNDTTVYYNNFENEGFLTFWGKANVVDSIKVNKIDADYQETYIHRLFGEVTWYYGTPDPYKDISPLGDTITRLFTYQLNDFFDYEDDSMNYFLDTCLTTNNNLPLVDSIPRYFSEERKEMYPNKSGWRYVYNDSDYVDHNVGHGFLMKKQYFSESAFDALCDTFAYDGYGNLTLNKDRLGNATYWIFSDVGDYKSYNHTFATRISDAEGNIVYMDYDTLTARLKKTKDANGNITEYKYDNIGRTLKVIEPGDSESSPTIKYYYDDDNNKIYVTTKRSNGDTTRVCSTYDAFGNVRTKAINGVIVDSFYYDNYSRLVKEVDAEGRTTWHRYDLLNRIIATVLPDSTPTDTTDNPVIQYSYSSIFYRMPFHQETFIYVSRKLVIDPEGNKTMHITDAQGQLRETREYISSGQYEDGIGNYERVWYDYDSMGNMTKARNEQALDNIYSYDGHNRLKEKDDFDRGESRNVYDILGRLRFYQSSKDTLDNRWVYNKYDQLSRLVENGTIINPDTTKADTVSYPSSQDIEKCYLKTLHEEKSDSDDPVPAPPGFYTSNPNLKGRLSAVYYDNEGQWVNVDAAECYEYDERGRLVHKGIHLMIDNSPKWYEIRYEYDLADNLTAMIYPDGSRVVCDYNNKNQLTKISDGADIIYNTFTYDASGLDTLENYGNTGSSLFQYNAGGLLKSMNIKMPGPFGPYSVFRRNYEYDKSGNLIYEKKDLTTFANYKYDALYRLTREQYPQDNNWLTTYTYDRAGNRKSANLTQYTIDSNSNRLVSQGGNYYYYNENGSMDSLLSGLSTTTLNYDYVDKLKQVNEGSDTTKYYYDGNGLRIRKWHITYDVGPGPGDEKGIDTDTGFVGDGGTIPPASIVTDRFYIHSGPGMVLLQDDNTPNYLTNPGFEDGSTGWSVYVPGGYGDNWEIDDSEFYAGSYSLKAASYDLSSYESYYQKFNLSEINLKTPFILSAYVKTSGVRGKGAQLLVQYESGDSTFLVYGSEYVTGTTSWHEVDLVVDSIPQEAERICITLRRYIGSGTVFFDAVRFENGATRTPEVKYIYGGGKRIALEKDGSIYYYHPDRLGSVRLITDESGTVLKRNNYTAFGSVLSDSGSFDNDYRYTSQAIDENDLYYMHARYYDKGIGRFTSCDPANSGHSYNYTGGNPTNFTDPSGLMYDYTQSLISYYDSSPVAEWHMGLYGPGGSMDLKSAAMERMAIYRSDPTGYLASTSPLFAFTLGNIMWMTTHSKVTSMSFEDGAAAGLLPMGFGYSLNVRNLTAGEAIKVVLEIYLMKMYGGEKGLKSYNQLMNVDIYAIKNPEMKTDRDGNVTATTTLAGWTSMETRNIGINFDICNNNWKLTEILAHESWHSRTGKGGFYEKQALSHGYRVRSRVYPWTAHILWYGSNWGWR